MQPELNPTQPPRRKRHARHEEHSENHSGGHDESNWLVSYADLMTLLFGFFVLMYSFSRVDTEKFEVVRKDMAKYFGGKQVDSPGAPEGIQKLSKELGASLQSELGQGLGSEFNVTKDGNVLIVTIGSDVLFPSGSSQLSEKAFKVIEKISTTLKSKKINSIEVEGHTDSDPISTVQFPSNWELSTARAASVVRVFESLNFSNQILRVTGYGSSRPLADIKNPQGQVIPHDKNKDRRVVLNLTVDPKENLKPALEAEGLIMNERNLDPRKAAIEDQAKTLQEKYEEMSLRMKEAADKLAKAKEEQKRIKELEKLAKKTADMESKIKEMEQKAQDAIQAPDQKTGQ